MNCSPCRRCSQTPKSLASDALPACRVVGHSTNSTETSYVPRDPQVQSVRSDTWILHVIAHGLRPGAAIPVASAHAVEFLVPPRLHRPASVFITNVPGKAAVRLRRERSGACATTAISAVCSAACDQSSSFSREDGFHLGAAVSCVSPDNACAAATAGGAAIRSAWSDLFSCVARASVPGSAGAAAAAHCFSWSRSGDGCAARPAPGAGWAFV